eukprot:536445-Pelagomonas_calceolata.AAC.4
MPQSSCSVRRLGAGRGAFTYNPSPMHCNSLHRRTPTEQDQENQMSLTEWHWLGSLLHGLAGAQQSSLP